MAGAEQAFPGGACTDESVSDCEGNCATVSFSFGYEMAVEETKMEGSAKGASAMCDMGKANDNFCDTMKNSMGSSMGAISDMKCKVSTCDTEKCNDPAKSSDSGKGDSEGKGEGEKEGEKESSFAVHGISFILISAVFGLLF